MNQNPRTYRLSLSTRWSNTLVIAWFVLLASAYFIFINRQYTDIFFESQFLHIDFLRDITQGQLTAKGFFTAFAEHVFPGYNFVLAVNYYLFGVWGGFDSIVYAVSLLITTIVVVGAIYRSSIHNKTLIALTAIFLLLSPTNNPQWGMALAAAIGVALFVASVWLITTSFYSKTNPNLFAYLALICAIIFFLGGYSVGVAGAIFLVLGVWVAHHQRIDYKIAATVGTVLVALLIYVLLVNRYGVMLANKPATADFVYKQVGQFGLLMIGSSIIGKAFFERTQQLWPYYLCGTILLYWCFCLFKEYIQRPSKERMFVLAIASYSLLNVFAVSLFRYRNGLDGAQGQWYNVHTHFIGVAVCYFLLSSIGEKKFTLNSIAKGVSILIILGFAAAGYYFDWKKSAYISGWKNQFVAQAPALLAFPDSIQNLNDPMSTMLWNYPQAKAGIEFLYSKNLWIFKNNKPLISGLSDDGWFESEKPLMIVCPSGSKRLSFRVWRPEGWKNSTVVLKQAGGVSSLLAINNSDIQLEFQEGKPAILLDGSNWGMSQPNISEGDSRHLVAIVKSVSCEGSDGQTNTMNVKPLPQRIELNVYNWGPQTAEIGAIPNKQPDGSMGIWIEVSDTQGLGDAQVIFDGKPAKTTSVQDKLITAAIFPEQLKVSGNKKIYIKQSKTGKLFTVGIFKVGDGKK